MTRNEVLEGKTYHVRLDDNCPLFVTVNYQDDKPFEVFVRCDEPEVFEWTTLTTILITRLLRAGESLQDIATELQEIHSPRTSHWLPGGKGRCPSLAARIGLVLEQHLRSEKS